MPARGGGHNVGNRLEPARPIEILLIENDEETVRRVTRLLVNEEEARFRVTSVPDVRTAVSEVEGKQTFDLVLLEFGLVRGDGAASFEALRAKDVRIPVIFLGARKELSMAVEAMRVGGRDFLPKEDLDVHVFPQTLIRHHERHQLTVGMEQLEIRRGRLEAMQELVIGVSEKVTEPLEQMRTVLATLESRNRDEKTAKYLMLIRENLERLSVKMNKLRNLKDDKTVKYIKDIKMIDLS